MTAATQKPLASTPGPTTDPRPTLAQRVAASILEDVLAIERELAVWKGEADRAKAHNEAEEVYAEAVEQANFFVLKVKALRAAMDAVGGGAAKG